MVRNHPGSPTSFASSSRPQDLDRQRRKIWMDRLHRSPDESGIDVSPKGVLERPIEDFAFAVLIDLDDVDIGAQNVDRLFRDGCEGALHAKPITLDIAKVDSA